MARIIKFRAWDTHRKKMYPAEELGKDELTLNPDGRGFVNVNSSNLRLSEYMPHLIPLEFTGLKDQKDKEIFEGDILKHGIFVGVVCLWRGFWDLEFTPNDVQNKPHTALTLLNDESEIIGNIYENPELMRLNDGC